MQERTFNLQLTEKELGVLSAALGELPIKVGMSLVNGINAQISAQLQKEHDAAADASDRTTGAPPPGII